MGHQAAVYGVRVHKRGKPGAVVPLGDIDERGTYLGDYFADLFATDFLAKNEERGEEVICSTSKLVGHDLRLMLEHGQTGAAATILSAAGKVRLRQQPGDTQVLRHGAVFHLPPNQTVGWWANHVINERSAKEPVHSEMIKCFLEDFPDLELAVDICAPGPAFKQVLGVARRARTKITEFDKSSDIKDGDKLHAQDSQAKVGLHSGVTETAKRLFGPFAREAADGGTLGSGPTFQIEGLGSGAKFDVLHPDGSPRTFNVRGMDDLITVDIEPETDCGQPVDASVLSELERVISETTPG